MTVVFAKSLKATIDSGLVTEIHKQILFLTEKGGES